MGHQFPVALGVVAVVIQIQGDEIVAVNGTYLVWVGRSNADTVFGLHVA